MKVQQHTAILIALCATLAQASALTWDANGTSSGQTNGGGAWLGANLWWNGTANQNWVSGSDASLGGPNTAGGAVTLASSTTVGSITFNTFTGTYTLGTVGQTITLNGGMTNNAASGAVSIPSSPVVLDGVQAWTNHSSGALTVRGGVNNNGHTLTLAGSGPANFDATANIITGAGGLTKTDPGRLVLGSGGTVPAHNYSGTTTLSGGVTLVSSYNIGPGNLVLNGGVIESYWGSNFTRALGADGGKVQITGGESGFSLNGATGINVILGGDAANEAVWGSEFFNPSALVLQAASAQSGSSVTFQNKIDLNGANRAIRSNATALAVSATVSGAIRNSTGTAGLIKTGPGLLVLTAANTYNGGTTITGGNLRFGMLTSMPAAGNVTVNSGTTLTVDVGGAGEWTTVTSGNGTIGGLLAGLGSQSGSTVSFAGDTTLGLETTGTLTYAGDIPNLGTSLGITKTGGSALTLSGNSSYAGRTRVYAGTLSFNSVGNVGGGNSALGAPATVSNGTIDAGYRNVEGGLIYTGTGHTSDRVINLAGTTGGATLDASGSGAWVLTSAVTATGVGAKTLTLTGTNTAGNSLPATALAGMADVLTVQKSGAGTWWVGGFTSPKNAWSITAGTLVVTGEVVTGDQQVTVSGGTLAGTGPITLQSTKSLIVQAAGSLAPGNPAAGTLAVTGKLDISGMAAGTGKLHFQLAASGASDKITVTGTAQIGAGVLGFNDFVFTDLGGMTVGTYVLLTAAGGITGTLDPANRSGTIGSLAGTLQINGNNLEWATDQDLDGMPDVYELANTTPPSATGHDPNADTENGGAGDGLTNLQEYLLGTNPNNPDTDADGLDDGVETNTGVWVSATNTGTNPLVLDSDGDTFRDGYETNTGIFAGATNTGTNPNKPDTDSDGLRDNVETHTGTFVSKTNTGTNPNAADTDNDGAGDWYEITASYTSPFLAGEKPNIPYPLPDPDASTGVTHKPVKVYIMSGQSNMVGIGYLNGTAPGSLETIAKRENKFPNLVDATNAWTTRNDVRYRGVVTAIGNGLLTPGVGGAASTQLGPELGFGHVMGYHHDEPVLLLKSSEGNRSLSWDILPPGSTSFDYNGNTYAGYGQSPNSWPIGGSPSPFIWYAGKQYDDFFLAESDMGPTGWAGGISYPQSCQVRHNGLTYVSTTQHTSNAASEPGVGAQSASFWNTYSAFNVTDVLDNFATQYPQWAAQGFEIAGFVWWQGHKDQGQPAADRYEQNLVNLINSLRTYYGNRYPGKIAPKAPFVLGTIGFGGWTLSGDGLTVANAQLAVDGEAVNGMGQLNYPAFAGNVKTIESRGYWRELPESPGTQGFHYNNNAETYTLVGDALGRAMIDLLAAAAADPTPPTLAGSAIVDDQGGGPVAVNTLVSYTVTFSEDMDASTVSAADFGNAGTATATIGTVTETAAGVFTVPVTPTSAGTLQLRVNAAAVLKDVAGNALVTTSAISDDTTLTVTGSYAAWAGGGAFTADANGDGVTNGLAWLLGAANPSANAGGLLPAPTREAGKLVLTFRCLKTANRAATVLKVQYSNDLGQTDPWTSHEAAVPDADGTVGGVYFDTTPDADPAFLNVRAEIPASAASPAGKLFGRLHSMEN